MANEIYKPTVYLETTIISYLTSWPSRDLQRASHQQITKEWWRTAGESYELFISQTVLDEISRGDAAAAKDRLASITGIPVLAPTANVETLGCNFSLWRTNPTVPWLPLATTCRRVRIRVAEATPAAQKACFTITATFKRYTQTLARDYTHLLNLPERAYNDAVHLAFSVVFEIDYVVTWNMKHLANSLTMRRLTEFNLSRSLHVTLLVTPEYLLPDSDQEIE